jgi:hypothetical protein
MKKHRGIHIECILLSERSQSANPKYSMILEKANYGNSKDINDCQGLRGRRNE